MSFYEGQQWPAAQARQPSWEQQRTDSPPSSSDPPTAFLTQIEEVDRALDNLSKSGKFYAGGPGAYGASSRHPGAARGYPDMPDGRQSGLPRAQPHGDFDGGRPSSTVGMPGFYPSQRFQPRPVEQDHRRVAAQREREMRNLHQDQQFNRQTPSISAERPLSPNSLNDEERRELIARQHRALYGQDATLYQPEMAGQRVAQDTRASVSGAARGPSPLSFKSFGSQKPQNAVEAAAQLPDGRTSISPPSAGRSAFGAGDTTSPPGTTSAASPIASPSLGSGQMPSIAAQGGMAPIGRRPPQAGTQLSSSPKDNGAGITEKTPVLGGWGSNSGVWGAPKNSLGVQASVWG